MNILRHFHNGLLAGTAMSAEGAPGGAGGGGDAPSEFVSSLPENLRGNEAFKGVKDAADLATRYADASKPFALPDKYTKDNPALKDIKSVDGLVERMLGAEKLVGADKGRVMLVPKDDAKPEEWDAFYAAQGRPAKAEDYKLPARADGKDYSDADKAFQKSVFPILQKVGLTQRQIGALAPEWDGLMAGMATADATARASAAKTTEDSLRTEYGAEYDARMGLAVDAIKHYSTQLKLGDQVSKELDAGALGNNPGLFKLLSHIGAQLKEDGLLGKNAEGFGDGLTPEAAKTQIAAKEAAFRANEKFADKNAPGRKEALAEISALYEIAYPGQKPPGA